MLREGRYKLLLIRLIILLVGFGLFIPSQSSAATLSQLLQQQADLQKQADQSRLQIQQKQQQANSLQNAIGNIDGNINYTTQQISTTQDQIANTTAVLAELNKQIDDNQTKLDALNQKLTTAYQNLYEMSQKSPLETLLESQSLNDLVSQTQYIQALQTNLQGDIEEVNSIKSDLQSKKQASEAQKTELEQLKGNLDASKSSLSSQLTQKNQLLQQTQGDQAKYEAILKQLEAQKETVSQQIYNLRRSLSSRFSDGGTGNYPYAGNCNQVDPWWFYTCQCTSFAAWHFLHSFGVPFNNTRPGSGDAYNWPNLAHDQGYHTSSTPRANVVVSWGRSAVSPNYGHVAWVTKVYPNGYIDVAEYNYRVAEGYGERYNINPLDPSFGTPTYIYP